MVVTDWKGKGIQTRGISSLIAKFMGPTWGPSEADRTQVGPMLAPWSLLSGYIATDIWVISNTFLWQNTSNDSIYTKCSIKGNNITSYFNAMRIHRPISNWKIHVYIRYFQCCDEISLRQIITRRKYLHVSTKYICYSSCCLFFTDVTPHREWIYLTKFAKFYRFHRSCIILRLATSCDLSPNCRCFFFYRPMARDLQLQYSPYFLHNTNQRFLSTIKTKQRQI